MMNSCLKPLIRIYYSSPNNGPSALTVSYKPEISLLNFLLICKLQADGRWQITPHSNTKPSKKSLVSAAVLVEGQKGEIR